MHSATKLVIGILIFLAGVYWYWPGGTAIANAMGIFGSTITAFKTVFGGLFGVFLIFLGLIVAWIEYEDLKWSRKEKKKK